MSKEQHPSTGYVPTETEEPVETVSFPKKSCLNTVEHRGHVWLSMYNGVEMPMFYCSGEAFLIEG